jgi:hypothetical protein
MRRLVLSGLGCVVAALAACSAFSGGDDGDAPVDTSDARANDGTTPSSGDGGDGDVGDGGTSTDSGTLVLSADDFDMGASCGWMLQSGAIAFPDAGGHSGARACVLCPSDLDGYMNKDVAAPGAGVYQLSGWARRTEVGDGAAITVRVAIQLLTDGGDPAGFSNGFTDLDDDLWHPFQAVANGEAATTNALLQVQAEGVCLLVDEIRFTKD